MKIEIKWCTKTVFDLIVTSDNTTIQETVYSSDGPEILAMFREITEELEDEFGEEEADRG